MSLISSIADWKKQSWRQLARSKPICNALWLSESVTEDNDVRNSGFVFARTRPPDNERLVAEILR